MSPGVTKARQKSLSDKLDITNNQLQASTSKVSQLGKRRRELESKVCELQKALNEKKDEFSDTAYIEILSKSEALPTSIFDLYAKKVKVCETNGNSIYIPKQAYSEDVKTFSLTLFSYSRKAYDYVRSKLENCLPSVSTIKKWLDKVDGSAGFSEQALQQLQLLVQEHKKR